MDNGVGIIVSTVLSRLYATVLERRISSWAEYNGLKLEAAGPWAGWLQAQSSNHDVFIMRTLIDSCKAIETGQEHGILALLVFARH